MEEAEALCARIGIMVGGRLRCVGSAQRLKSRYAEGYQLEMKLSPPTPAQASAAAARAQLGEMVAPQVRPSFRLAWRHVCQ
jgi:ABC-type multidrug transport system ATPase subunit